MYIYSCITVCETFPYSLRVKKNPQKYFIIILQKKKFTSIFTIIIFFLQEGEGARTIRILFYNN